MLFEMKITIYICRTVFVLGVICAASATAVHAQQPLGSFMHYQHHLELVNQAYVHATDAAKVYAVGRLQWTGIEGAPKTVLAGGHFKTGNERAAFGAQLLYDKMGPERYTEAGAFYSYDLKLTEVDYISMSLGIGMRWYDVNFASLGQTDQMLTNDINESIAHAKLSLLYYRPEQFYVGVTLPQKIGGEDVKGHQVFQNRYSVVAAYIFAFDESLHIKANTWLSWAERGQDFWGNFSALAYFNRRIGVGVNYMTNNLLGFIASAHVDKRFKVGYGYQMGVGSMIAPGFAGGAHELSISYHFNRSGRPSLL